MLAGGNNHD